MGTILEFPADAASRRQGLSIDGSPRRASAKQAAQVLAKQTSAKQTSVKPVMGQVLILPVVRIERQLEETSGGRGPEEGTATPRRRRRRR
jgi:hypothetical protein